MTNAVEQLRKHISSLSDSYFFWMLVLIAALLFFAGLNSRKLFGSDEPRVAGIAAETAIYGNWTEPALNGKPFLEKPPLYLWCDALSLKLFGNNEFAAKLPSASSAFLGVLALFMLARRMGASGLSAFISGLILATSAQYWDGGRKCMIDIMLAVFILFAFWTFYQLVQAEKLKHKIWWFLALTLSLGGALFAKGLVGLAIPAVAIGAWLFFRDLSNRKLAPGDWLWFAGASLLAFIPVGLWLWELYDHAGYDAVYTVVWTNNFGRFTGGHAEHIEPFYYYLRKLPGQLQPWTILLPFAIVYSARTFWKQERHSKNKKYPFLYMLCWLVIPYLLLTISAGKRQVYVLPLYAAEALMIGFMLGNFLEGAMKLPWKMKQVAVIRYATIGLTAIILACPIIITVFTIKYKLVGVSTVAFILLGVMTAGLSVYALYKKNLAHFFIGFIAMLVIGFISIENTLRAHTSHKKSFEYIFKYCHALEHEQQKQIVLYAPRERASGAAVFYLKHRVNAGGSIDWLNQKLTDPSGRTVIVIYRKRLKTPDKLASYKILKSFKIKHADLLVITGDKN